MYKTRFTQIELNDLIVKYNMILRDKLVFGQGVMWKGEKFSILLIKYRIFLIFISVILFFFLGLDMIFEGAEALGFIVSPLTIILLLVSAYWVRKIKLIYSYVMREYNSKFDFKFRKEKLIFDVTLILLVVLGLILKTISISFWISILAMCIIRYILSNLGWFVLGSSSVFSKLDNEDVIFEVKNDSLNLALQKERNIKLVYLIILGKNVLILFRKRRGIKVKYFIQVVNLEQNPEFEAQLIHLKKEVKRKSIYIE